MNASDKMEQIAKLGVPNSLVRAVSMQVVPSEKLSLICVMR